MRLENLIYQEVRARNIVSGKRDGMKEWIVEGIPIEIKI